MISFGQVESSISAVAFGVVGAGGYAEVICQQLMAGAAGRLVGVCEPDQRSNASRLAALRGAGIAIFDSINGFLAQPFDAIWLPVPIDLHRPFLEKALAAGKAVMVEKPAAGCIQDVDAMIAARDKSEQLVAVGFQHLYDPALHQLKKEIANGVIGRVISGSVRVCWPRDGGYYQRTDWAGRLSRDGHWILDSPANNAMAHYIAMLLYLLGAPGQCMAEPTQVEAELYRVNEIENYDTCSFRITLSGGVPILVLLTHACEKECGPIIEIRGQQGLIRLDDHIEIQSHQHTTRRPAATFEQLQMHMQEAFARRLSGRDAPIATLEMARAHTIVVNGASEAAHISTIPNEYIARKKTTDGKILRALPGIEQIFEQCQAEEKMLHESGLVEWSKPAGSRDLRGYSHFAGPAIRRAPQTAS